jgi:integrase
MQTRLELSRTGFWELRFAEKLPSGKWRTRTVSTREKDHGAAQSFQRHFEAQMMQAVAPAGGMTVGDLLEEYYKAKFGNRPSSDTNVRLINYLKADLGTLYPAELNDQVIKAYGARLGVSIQTLRNRCLTLRAALNHAVKRKLIKSDDVGFFDLPSPSPARDVWLNEDEEAEVYAAAMGHSIGAPRLSRLTRFIAIALDTGQRRGVILTLKWPQVDWKAGTIDFRKKGVKTNKRQGVVPISTRLRPLLERAYKERINDYVLDVPTDIQKQFDNFMAKIGKSHVTAHVLRHTTATLMARAGVPLWEIAGVLGNSVSMIASVYAHHAPDHLRGALDKRFQ